MLPNLQYAAIRYENFHSEVLMPQVFPLREPLKVGMWQARGSGLEAGHPSLADAKRAKYRPVEVGLRWGPVWSTAWFRLAGRVPAAMRGHTVALRFSCGTEATLWRDGVPFQGFDPYRDLAFLSTNAKGGEKIDLLVEGACNLPLGISTFWWDHPELQTRWREPSPGRLESAELVVVDEAAWRYAQAWDFVRRLMLALPEDSARATEIANGLRDIHACIDARDPVPGMEETASALDELVKGGVHEPATACIAVGHAHIDTAWLWPLRETRRKCLRSFSNQLRLMEQFPEYKVLCSQAQQYAWVEESSPELFSQISTRVAEGRWEPGGAMWIEPDANCPSGESLVRQIQHGTSYWRSKFGDAASQHFLYLPDTFGFPATLPQIMAHAGLTTFVTNKMVWSRSNVFPHTTFAWRGLDGTEVLAHNTPGHDYNAVNTPKELHKGEVNHRTRTTAPAIWLQPFGYGDGGGGPTDWSIRYAQIAADCDGMPRVRLSTPREFCRELHAQHERTQGTPEAFPTWSGELYLEIHRGTLTSQAWIKTANRRAEEDLRFAELLAFSPPPGAASPTPESVAKLDRAWKTLLLQQFHDILPGSSIGWVYEDSRRDFARIAKVTDAMIDKGTTAWLSGLSTAQAKEPVGVFNPCSSAPK